VGKSELIDQEPYENKRSIKIGGSARDMCPKMLREVAWKRMPGVDPGILQNLKNVVVDKAESGCGRIDKVCTGKQQ
jgi:hypothetical protein